MTEEKFQEVDETDLIYEAYDRGDALLELLVDKGIITMTEYEEKLQEVIDRNYEDSEE